MKGGALVVVVPIAAGALIAWALPHREMIEIEFARGGRVWRYSAHEDRALPSTLNLKDNGLVQLRVVNRDSVTHSAGVLSLAPGDSIVVSPELCSITLGQDGLRTIVMR